MKSHIKSWPFSLLLSGQNFLQSSICIVLLGALVNHSTTLEGNIQKEQEGQYKGQTDTHKMNGESKSLSFLLVPLSNDNLIAAHCFRLLSQKAVVRYTRNSWQSIVKFLIFNFFFFPAMLWLCLTVVYIFHAYCHLLQFAYFIRNLFVTNINPYLIYLVHVFFFRFLISC